MIKRHCEISFKKLKLRKIVPLDIYIYLFCIYIYIYIIVYNDNRHLGVQSQ